MGEAAVKSRIIKARYMGLVDEHNREHPWGDPLRITSQHREILRVIVGFIARGQLHPSYQRIAALCDCCVDTVWRAIARLRAAGLLTWFNEWRRDHERGKWIKTTNTYALEEPTKTENPGATPARFKKELRKFMFGKDRATNGDAAMPHDKDDSFVHPRPKPLNREGVADRRLAEAHLVELARRAAEPITPSPELAEHIKRIDAPPAVEPTWPKLSAAAQALVRRQRGR